MTLKDTLKEEREIFDLAFSEVVSYNDDGTTTRKGANPKMHDWLDQHDTRILNALLEEIKGRKPSYDVAEKHGKETNCSFSCHSAGEETALTDLAEIIKLALEK